MTMTGKIRGMHFCPEKSLREVSRTTSRPRNTACRHPRMAQVRESRYVRVTKATTAMAIHETIVAALTTDARRPKRDRRTALALYREIEAQGHTGSCSRR